MLACTYSPLPQHQTHSSMDENTNAKLSPYKYFTQIVLNLKTFHFTILLKDEFLQNNPKMTNTTDVLNISQIHVATTINVPNLGKAVIRMDTFFVKIPSKHLQK